MKRFLIILISIFLFVCNICNAQNGKAVVQAFAESMQIWLETDDISYRERIEEICNGGKQVRIKDDFTKRIAMPLIETSSFTLDTYLNNIALLQPNINISYSNFESVRNTIGQTMQESENEVEYVSCDVHIEGSIKLSMKEIFIVRNGKVTKIFSITPKDYKKWKKVKK